MRVGKYRILQGTRLGRIRTLGTMQRNLFESLYVAAVLSKPSQSKSNCTLWADSPLLIMTDLWTEMEIIKPLKKDALIGDSRTVSPGEGRWRLV